MLNSIVAKVASEANAEVLVYQVPGTKVLANVSIVIANLGAASASVRLGKTTGATLATADLIEAGVSLNANNGVLRRTNLIMGPNEKLIIQSPSGDLAVRVYGLEQQ